MKKLLLVFSAVFLFSAQAHASFIGFTASAATNSSDWITAVLNLGATINSNVNFDAHPTGELDSGFYSASEGVTLTQSGGFGGNLVTFGPGPGQSNTSSTPVSSGEGVHGASNYYEDLSADSYLTLNFDDNVLGGGLYIIDLFNPDTFNESATLSAYSGVNGTGSLLGSVSAAGFNFQSNNAYFFGVVSTDNNIRSLVYRDVDGGAGDNTGVDNILFARLPGGDNGGGNGNENLPTGAVPEPASLILFGSGLLAAAVRLRK